MDKQTTIELLKYSNAILEIVEDKDKMTNSDYQGAIEAVINNAFYYGVGKGVRAVK